MQIRHVARVIVIASTAALAACASDYQPDPDDNWARDDWGNPCNAPAHPEHRTCDDKAADEYVVDGPLGPIEIER